MSTRIKRSFACSAIHYHQIETKSKLYYIPRAGDVALFRVASPQGNYIIGPGGVQHQLFEGDEVLAAFGARYATNQYEGYVPTGPVSACQLLGRGGVAGWVRSVNPTFKNPPCELELIGYAVDEKGDVCNTIRYESLSSFAPDMVPNQVILSVGSSMDSGKTTTAGYLCGGLRRAGHSVAYVKLTGTAFPKDARFAFDCGADFACDFSHFGFPSTFQCDLPDLLDLYQSLIDLVNRQVNPEFVVVEIADGLIQRETEMLLTHPVFMSTVSEVIFSCGDSLGVFTGVKLLTEWGVRPLALSGLFTASELLIREAERFTSLPILRRQELMEGKMMPLLRADARAKQAA